MKTPVLFLVFNRPEITAKVFEEIKRARPERLFIAADGPRFTRPDDIKKCQQAREAVATIDWQCEVKRLYQEKNLGCKVGVQTALTWFFNLVEEGIVIEDDCLPDQTFFRFCEEILEKYRDDERFAIISGHNVVGTLDTPYSYVFTRFGHLWGWASWRRVWKLYEPTMTLWAHKENRKKIERAMNDPYMWHYRQRMYTDTYLGKKDTWDYQWESYRILHGILSIIPSHNMVENLGFGPDATHTKNAVSPLILPRLAMPFPLVHNPGPFLPDDAYDRAQRPPYATRTAFTSRIIETLKSFSRLFLPSRAYNRLRKSLRWLDR